MANPTISATPNPTSSSTWSITQKGDTTISWDTGTGKPLGTVWVTDESGLHALIDRTGKPAVGVTGKAPTRISLGKTYLFQLKRTDNPAVILASVTVECRELMGLPGGLLGDIGIRAPLSQGITNLRVLPDIDWVRILFRTRQPTVPVIDVKDAATQALAGAAFPLLAAPRTQHDFTFPLAQNTNFEFHIVAPPATGSASTTKAELSGLFRTGLRSGQVFFDQLYMHRDGDPDALGAGEFRFNMGAGNIDDGSVFGAVWFLDDISGGEFRTINQSVPIAQMPIGLWVQVFSDEDDSIFWHFLADPSISFAPEGSVLTYQDDDGESEGAIVTKWFDLSGTGQAPQEIPFTLETGPKRINFSLNGRLRIEGTPGAVLQPMLAKSAKPILGPKTMATMVAGDHVAVTGRTKQVLHLAHDGGVYRANAVEPTIMRAATRAVRWTRVASDSSTSLTVVAAEDGLLHLLAAGTDGELRHRAVSPEAVKDADRHHKWSSLGGSFEWPPAVAVTKEGIDLFALNAEGAVFHRALTRDSVGEWTKVGEGITSSLNAFTTQRGEIALVALGRKGEIVHLPWVPGGARSGASNWQTVATAPPGTLAAEVIDDVVVLAVLSEDETVQAAPWRNYPDLPSPLEWRKLGTINTLIDSRYSLLPPVATVGEGEGAR